MFLLASCTDCSAIYFIWSCTSQWRSKSFTFNSILFRSKFRHLWYCHVIGHQRAPPTLDSQWERPLSEEGWKRGRSGRREEEKEESMMGGGGISLCLVRRCWAAIVCLGFCWILPFSFFILNKLMLSNPINWAATLYIKSNTFLYIYNNYPSFHSYLNTFKSSLNIFSLYTRCQTLNLQICMGALV